MVNDFMLVLTCKAVVAAVLIREECGTYFHVLFHNRVHGYAVTISNHLSANFSATLDHSHHDYLMVLGSLTRDFTCSNVSVHVPRFAADESFVGFDFFAFATKFHSRTILH